MAALGMLPMLVRTTFTSWPALASMRLRLYFMVSLAVNSKVATAGAAATGAAASSFLPQPTRIRLPANTGRRTYLFIRIGLSHSRRRGATPQVFDCDLPNTPPNRRNTLPHCGTQDGL